MRNNRNDDDFPSIGLQSSSDSVVHLPAKQDDNSNTQLNTLTSQQIQIQTENFERAIQEICPEQIAISAQSAPKQYVAKESAFSKALLVYKA